MPEAVESAYERVVTEEKYYTGIPVDLSSVYSSLPFNKTAAQIATLIEQFDGRIPFSKFMETSLYGIDGYYSSGRVNIGHWIRDNDLLNRSGIDFSTSPETSEAFGATLGRGLKKIWEAMGRPDKFQIVEMGAGQGAMAYSLIKWAAEFEQEFFQVMNYTIVEISLGMINRQKEALDPYEKVKWIIGSAYHLPVRDITGAFISNELLDAFPIERVVKINGELRQKYVSIEDGKWVEELGELTPEVNTYINRFNIDMSSTPFRKTSFCN